MIYCVDTSSLIAAWQERYTIENFPKFWDRMEALIYEERLVAPIEVFHETKKRSDELHAWLKTRKDPMLITKRTEGDLKLIRIQPLVEIVAEA